ncbi:MAG TPA: alpha/beta fold hydrolase [Roseiarcus sp.]
MFDNFERRVITVDGTDIACVLGGSGLPVLMLHGFPQNLAMWARVAPQLAQDFTVVCADLRGYGDSAKPPCLPDRSNSSFRTFAADQVGLMERLGSNASTSSVMIVAVVPDTGWRLIIQQRSSR